MNRWFILALIWLLVVVQVALLATIRPFGIVPQLLLVGILFVASYRSMMLTMVAAIWGAWWLLVFSPLPGGYWLVLYPLAALLVYGASRMGVETIKWSGMVMILVVTILLVNFLAVGAQSVWVGEMLVGWSLVWLAAVEAVFTFVLAWLLRPLLQLIVRPVN